MEKSKSVISWGQLFLIFGTVCLFLFVLISSVKFDKKEEVVILENYEINSGTITAYTGDETIVYIPKSYSLGPTTNITGSITFNYEYEAFEFLNEYYSSGTTGYYDFYSQIYSQTYPWVYNYSIDKPSYIQGNDFQIKSIGDSAFKNNKKIEKIVLSENIESIGNFAFENCTNLTEIQFNDKIKSIGDTSFGRTGIKEIVIPNSIERIYPYAFFDCNKLETVILGKNVKDIYLGTFNDCNNLKTVTILSNYEIKATSTSYYQTFSRCSSLQTIYVKAEHLSYYQNNSPWNLYKEKYQILN